ncbi:MAG: type II toxin-antitoxin system VapC family toxin [Pseudomonadota bacterium]
MSDLVVDCSVILAYLYPDEALTDRERQLLETSTLTAPDLIGYEVANSIAMSARKGRLQAGRDGQLVQTFLSLSIETRPCGPLDALLELARRHGLTAYDAAYLELALRRGVPLLTRGRALAAAASAAGSAA